MTPPAVDSPLADSPPFIPQGSLLGLSDFERLGVAVNEFRPLVIRRAAVRRSRKLANRLLHRPDVCDSTELSHLSLATYRLLDPRRRQSDQARAYVGRILPQTLSASNPVQFVGLPKKSSSEADKPFSLPQFQSVPIDIPRAPRLMVGDSLRDTDLLAQPAWSRQVRHHTTLLRWAGAAAAAMLVMVGWWIGTIQQRQADDVDQIADATVAIVAPIKNNLQIVDRHPQLVKPPAASFSADVGKVVLPDELLSNLTAAPELLVPGKDLTADASIELPRDPSAMALAIAPATLSTTENEIPEPSIEGVYLANPFATEQVDAIQTVSFDANSLEVEIPDKQPPIVVDPQSWFRKSAESVAIQIRDSAVTDHEYAHQLHEAFAAAVGTANLPNDQIHLLRQLDAIAEIFHLAGLHSELKTHAAAMNRWAEYLEDAESQQHIASIVDEAERLAKIQGRAGTAGEALSPTDRVAARYRAFARNRWAEMLPILAAGGDPLISAAATAELQLASSPDDRLAVARRWRTIASRLDGSHQQRIVMRHADEVQSAAVR